MSLSYHLPDLERLSVGDHHSSDHLPALRTTQIISLTTATTKS